MWSFHPKLIILSDALAAVRGDISYHPLLSLSLGLEADQVSGLNWRFSERGFSSDLSQKPREDPPSTMTGHNGLAHNGHSNKV